MALCGIFRGEQPCTCESVRLLVRLLGFAWSKKRVVRADKERDQTGRRGLGVSGAEMGYSRNVGLAPTTPAK